MNNVLDIFYNEIIKEAAIGRIDCNMMYNTLFQTKINNKIQYQIPDFIKKYQDFYIPTLFINNKEEFDQTLCEYFYNAKRFYTDIDTDIYNDKAILTLLWNNATEEDFKNPVAYMKRIINFMNSDTLSYLNNETDLGYSSVLDSNISAQIKKEKINEETPYGFYLKTNKDSLDYEFPVVRFGIDSNKAYIYAIQQIKNKKLEEDSEYFKELNKYQKKVHRSLFKINENFVEDSESIDNTNNPENLTGISPSSVVTLTALISILEKNGITELIIPTILPVRYNAKEMSYIIRLNFEKSKGRDFEGLQDLLHDFQTEHDRIQTNLSDKLLRTVRRIDNSFTNINMTSYPFEVDSYSHFNINKNINCNNPLLEEIYNMSYGRKRMK